MSPLGHVSKIVSILLCKLSDCPNTDTSLCYCNNPFFNSTLALLRSLLSLPLLHSLREFMEFLTLCCVVFRSILLSLGQRVHTTLSPPPLMAHSLRSRSVIPSWSTWAWGTGERGRQKAGWPIHSSRLGASTHV